MIPRSLWKAGGLALSFLAIACSQAVAIAPPTPPPLPQPTPIPLSPALEEGRRLFVAKGCVACHGVNLDFLVVVGLPEISVPAVMQQARKPSGMMPVFSEAMVTDEELREIAAFVVALLRLRGTTGP